MKKIAIIGDETAVLTSCLDRLKFTECKNSVSQLEKMSEKTFEWLCFLLEHTNAFYLVEPGEHDSLSVRHMIAAVFMHTDGSFELETLSFTGSQCPKCPVNDPLYLKGYDLQINSNLHVGVLKKIKELVVW